jgi:hypothetical protein
MCYFSRLLFHLHSIEQRPRKLLRFRQTFRELDDCCFIDYYIRVGRNAGKDPQTIASESYSDYFSIPLDLASGGTLTATGKR